MQIGGVDAYTATPIEYVDCIGYEGLYFADEKSGVVSFEVTVPRGVPPGEQTVAVYGHEGLEHFSADNEIESLIDKDPCADVRPGSERGSPTGQSVKAVVKAGTNALVERTVEISTQSLTISPDTAVRGQRVTVSGSGFAQSTGDDIQTIPVNGVSVAEDPSRLEVSHNGDFAAIVTVPMGVRAGENEVQVKGSDGTFGTGSLTVTEPTVTLDPPQGQRGTQVTVTGSGFVASGFVRVAYGDGGDVNSGDDYVAFGQADDRGNFELPFRVPLTAGIGRAYKVTAAMEMQDEAGTTTYMAEAGHSPPQGR